MRSQEEFQRVLRLFVCSEDHALALDNASRQSLAGARVRAPLRALFIARAIAARDNPMGPRDAALPLRRARRLRAARPAISASREESAAIHHGVEDMLRVAFPSGTAAAGRSRHGVRRGALRRRRSRGLRRGIRRSAPCEDRAEEAEEAEEAEKNRLPLSILVFHNKSTGREWPTSIRWCSTRTPPRPGT